MFQAPDQVPQRGFRDIRGRALHRRVVQPGKSRIFAEGELPAGERPFLGGGRRRDALMPCGYARIGFEKALAEGRGLLLRHVHAVGLPCVSRQSRSAHPENQAKVHGLGRLALGLCHAAGRRAADQGRGEGVQVLSLLIGFHHAFVAGDAGRHPELDLGIIGDDQLFPFGRAKATPKGLFPGDLLDVGAAAAHAAAGSADLVVFGMQPPGHGVDHGGDGI